MGPLVPEIISDEFNFVIALILGFGFGFVLEQAGFSSTKKLVGLFYGYDFTVLRVFFTAGITALIGSLVLSHFGLLDLSVIYINPTFLTSAIVGGLIMGAGFIIGGFCPGTSVCAAAIGKLDGMLFVLGSGLGIFLFTEGYPLFENLYLARNWGPVLINDTFNLSKIAFGFILSGIAVGAFIGTNWIQHKINGTTPNKQTSRRLKYSGLILAPFFILLILAIFPNYQQRIENYVNNSQNLEKIPGKMITADELALNLSQSPHKFNLIDIRSPEQYKKSHLPLAINVPFDSMRNREWENLFLSSQKTNIYYSDSNLQSRKASLLAYRLGNHNHHILKGDATQFLQTIMNPTHPGPHASKNQVNTYYFRLEASNSLKSLSNQLSRFHQPVKKKIRKAKGGCS